MITVQQLAEIVGRKVQLKRCGPTSWKGCCPVHDDRNPSFYVYLGRRGEGRYQCKVCGERVCGGDAVDWLRKFEGNALTVKPDPELARRREEERQHEQRRRLLFDVYPDLTPEAELFLGDADPLTTLKFRLRLRLAR